MRAWLLLLAVLATFQPIVQVASTEDISSKFITAISPAHLQSTDLQRSATARTTNKSITTIQTTTTTTTALSKAFNPVIDLTSISSSATLLPLSSSSSTTTTTTALSSPTSLSSPPSSSWSTSRAISTPLETAIGGAAEGVGVRGGARGGVSAASTFLYENSDSDNKKINNNKHNNNNSKDDTDNVIIIDIKNIEEIDGIDRVNEIQNQKNLNHRGTVQVNRQSERTDQLESHSKRRQLAKLVQETPTIETMDVQMISEITTTTTSSTERQHTDHQRHHTKKEQPHHHHHHQQQQHGNPEESATAGPTTVTKAAVDDVDPVDLSSSSAVAADHAAVSADGDSDSDIDGDRDDEEEPATYSNKEIIGEKVKPDPSTLVEIENSLLSLFNMKRPPKIDRSKIVIPEAMKQLYAQIMGHELDSVNIPKPGLLTKSANTVRSFTHQDSKIDDRFPHHHRFRLHFDVKSIPGEEKLKAAELQLTRDAISHAALNPRLANRTRYQVLVYDITRVGVRGKREPSYLLLDNKTIRLNSTETMSLDVQPAVNRWLASPKKNFGLLVEVRTMRALKPAPHPHVRLRRSADEPHDSWQHKQPLLFTYTDDGRHKARSIRDVSTRSKRAGHHRRPHRRKNNEEICRRHALYVDFGDVGWSDWIVAPPGYDAFYCHGKCPFPLAEHLNSTNHAVVQTLVNNINPGKVPKACCVPTQLEGISMLYLNDQNTVVLKNYQEMTVVGCGCR